MFIIKFLELITIAIPPTLPIALSAGIDYSLNRLRDINVLCTFKKYAFIISLNYLISEYLNLLKILAGIHP